MSHFLLFTSFIVGAPVRYFTVWGVGVGGADVTVRAVELADIFG